MKRLSVIHLRATEFFGGPERAILGQCRSMTDVDFTCASFVRRNRPNVFLDNVSGAGFGVARIHDSFAGDFRVVGQIRNLVRERQADILVTHDYKANFFGRLALRNTGAKHIAHFRGETQVNLKDRIYNYINSRVLRKVPTVLAVSQKSADILRQMDVPSSVLRVVPNAIEAKRLVPPDFVRRPDPGRVQQVVAAGRLSHEKGYDILLRAVALACPKSPPFVVKIYGFGPEHQDLLSLAKELGISEVIDFCGFVDDMLPVFSQSDLLILPSRSEGMPNVILESWSQKLGVISTAVGGVPEMIKHQVSGLLASPESPESLAEQLAYGLAHPEQMIQFGQAGYELVQTRYSYEKQAELLDNIYRGVIAG